MAKKGGLGKGLDAIFYDNAREDDAGAVELSINDLEPNRTQPRQSFDDGAMTRRMRAVMTRRGTSGVFAVR